MAELFRELGINGVKKFESIDRQYHAVKRALERCPQDLTSYAFYTNALLAYKLKMLGEVFWEIFANHIIGYCSDAGVSREFIVKLVEDFTYRYNNYLIEQKIKRLKSLAACSKLWSLLGTRRYLDIARETAKCLKTSINTKTVVFSIKMLYYVHKAQGLDTILPFELSIPVDRRVAYITYTSGLVNIINNNYKNRYLVDILLRNAKIIRKVWDAIALETHIPPLHIDSVIWYFGKYAHVKDLNNVLTKIDDVLYEMLGENLVQRLVKEFFYRLLI